MYYNKALIRVVFKERRETVMKKTISLIAVLMAIVLLLSACGKKTITEKDFAGKWSVTDSSAAVGSNMGNFISAVTKYTGLGGIIVSGDRICLAQDLERDIRFGDICTFEVKNNKLIIHDLGTEDVPAFGDFEADFKLEGKKLTLTNENGSATLEKKK